VANREGFRGSLVNLSKDGGREGTIIPTESCLCEFLEGSLIGEGGRATFKSGIKSKQVHLKEVKNVPGKGKLYWVGYKGDGPSTGRRHGKRDLLKVHKRSWKELKRYSGGGKINEREPAEPRKFDKTDPGGRHKKCLRGYCGNRKS